MTTEIRVPKIGASVTRVSIGRWFKRVGDPVSLSEPLVEIETDGTTVEVPASACRFEMTVANAPSGDEFCMFEFPGCEGCPKAQHTVQSVGCSEDRMKSDVWRGWIARASRPEK